MRLKPSRGILQQRRRHGESSTCTDIHRTAKPATVNCSYAQLCCTPMYLQHRTHPLPHAYNVCMYACMYACKYVCMMYICIYVCMYVCMYACMHVCMYVRMYVCMYVCTYVRMHTVGMLLSSIHNSRVCLLLLANDDKVIKGK